MNSYIKWGLSLMSAAIIVSLIFWMSFNYPIFLMSVGLTCMFGVMVYMLTLYIREQMD